eukprot:m.424476 g.424476  ORF g.424476 m.424476 type:complete len:79 (+) comp16856_c0_seq62:125-361(+)
MASILSFIPRPREPSGSVVLTMHLRMQEMAPQEMAANKVNVTPVLLDLTVAHYDAGSSDPSKRRRSGFSVKPYTGPNP